MADSAGQQLGFQQPETVTWDSQTVPQTETPIQDENEALMPHQVSDYLDYLTAGLLKLPYAERDAIRTEVRLHLLASIAAFEEIGESRESAIPQALAQFGEPGLLARSFVRSWESTGRNRHTFPKAAMLQTMRFFSFCALFVFIFLSFLINIPWQIVGTGGIVASKVLLALLLGIPMWGGWRMSVYRRAALGTFYGLGALATAMVPILIFSDLLPPVLKHVPYLGAIFAAWTPIAAISAGISHLCSQRQPSHRRLT